MTVAFDNDTQITFTELSEREVLGIQDFWLSYGKRLVDTEVVSITTNFLTDEEAL